MPEFPAQRTARRDSEPGALRTVLHLAQPVDGGVARVVTDLARAQADAGLDVVVACPGRGPLPHLAAAAGARTALWSAVREPGACVAAEVYGVQRVLRAVRPDLVHAHSAKAGLAARLALRGRLPTVYQPHAWSFEAATGHTARLARAWERYAARWADRVLCVSEAERDAGAAAGVRAGWAVVHNGVDTARFPAPGTRQAGSLSPTRFTLADLSPSGVRNAPPSVLRDLPPSAVLVVCVGRLCEQKGQRTLLAAWPRVAAQVPNARLVLVGDGPDREQLRRAAPPGVVFAGASDEVRDWYAAADLVVLPSLWEGMALTPLEAMACGRPVVVSDVAGSRELLPPGQELPCLVPPADPDALAVALVRLALDPGLRTELGRAVQRHVRARFDVRGTAAAVLELYREVLRQRGATADVPVVERAGSR
ncbi:glycosyltransferase [Streptomyces oryzae]|uniref:Glycosyltransferase n=1 Tax=Streptomyces oryzae TaxID=1434886 RepID=A0ABS3XBU9_9ACTN|nr:glycosyltransferase [Streptomyces oryzae]MBO8192858.1 glycosyltransferase [Streptomyces oryzae]